jgi:hypothetical protein
LEQILEKEKDMKMMANPFTISISGIMIQTTKAKIESIKEQITSYTWPNQYIDRRDGLILLKKLFIINGFKLYWW